MTLLLDVNVLVAVAWPEHVQHPAALKWFDQHADSGWATCSLTELGFLRISANAAVVGNPVPPPEAAELLTALTQVGIHHFWPDALVPSAVPPPLDRVRGHRQVTDAYLVALSRHHNGKLATFDRGLRALGGADSVELLGS